MCACVSAWGYTARGAHTPQVPPSTRLPTQKQPSGAYLNCTWLLSRAASLSRTVLPRRMWQPKVIASFWGLHSLSYYARAASEKPLWEVALCTFVATSQNSPLEWPACSNKQICGHFSGWPCGSHLVAPTSGFVAASQSDQVCLLGRTIRSFSERQGSPLEPLQVAPGIGFHRGSCFLE